jgi:predicted dehydrogenase/threonine dehydrogenase-like Zn-dependent dehydrogenase
LKQLIQNFKTGELYVDEVPVPSLSTGFVIIENKFSLISSGTERGTVKVAQASLLGKAKQRPDLVAQVLQNIRKEGISATLKKVQTKLDSLKALGYSSAGVVMASMDKNSKFQAGDRVACAGQDYASHAEVVSVPQNLVARIPDNVSFEEAAFTTLGAIALQGVRQAEPRLGENVCVIGLGLLGQLTCQLLRANGCHVLGIDLSDRLIALASENSADMAINRSQPDLEKICSSFTNGFGFDSIIITAAAPTNDPIELAAELSRKKGKIIIVGAVKMEVPRDPHFYRKELDLRMSCSYGPGRYDSSYEEDGMDYPHAYVRWTEQRNMEAFLALVSKKLINLKPLITQQFEIDEAEKAFDIVLGKTQEPHIGILLRYPENEKKKQTRIQIVEADKIKTAVITAGFIGAGSFAQSYLIPNAKANGVALHTVSNARGITSKNVAQKFGFGFSSSSAEDVINSTEINTVFIATPHNSHASLVSAALRAGKHVFVEKPLSIDYAGLEEVMEAKKVSKGVLMVGFNRRFSSAAQEIQKKVAALNEPVVMNFRVNAGIISKEHWIQKPDIGGGRIIGEMCHFFDLMEYMSGAHPIKVYAESIQTENDKFVNQDNVVITVKFANGSIGTLTYVSNGDTSMPKEKLEVFCGGLVGVIHDFRNVVIHNNGKETKTECTGKGHREEVNAFMNAIQQSGEDPIPFDSIIRTTLVSFKAIESLNTGLPQQVD